VYWALVEELSGMVKSMTAQNLQKMHLTAEQLRTQALENLEHALTSGRIGSTEFPKGPRDKPFLVIGGHWAASACCILPLMPGLARQKLGSQEVCFSVPHTEALLLFPKGDRAYRDEMRAVIREQESDGRKRLTWELFEYRGNSVVPFDEEHGV
jgi:hypothetical protein